MKFLHRILACCTIIIRNRLIIQQLLQISSVLIVILHEIAHVTSLAKKNPPGEILQIVLGKSKISAENDGARPAPPYRQPHLIFNPISFRQFFCRPPFIAGQLFPNSGYSARFRMSFKSGMANSVVGTANYQYSPNELHRIFQRSAVEWLLVSEVPFFAARRVVGFG